MNYLLPASTKAVRVMTRLAGLVDLFFGAHLVLTFALTYHEEGVFSDSRGVEKVDDSIAFAKDATSLENYRQELLSAHNFQ